MDAAADALLDTRVQAYTAYFNQVLVDSGIDLTMNTVHYAIDSSYDENGKGKSRTLRELTNPGDGIMDEAHSLREEYAADFIVGIRAGGGGVAWVPYTQPDPYYGK